MRFKPPANFILVVLLVLELSALLGFLLFFDPLDENFPRFFSGFALLIVATLNPVAWRTSFRYRRLFFPLTERVSLIISGIIFCCALERFYSGLM